jgi:hypothetical protein
VPESPKELVPELELPGVDSGVGPELAEVDFGVGASVGSSVCVGVGSRDLEFALVLELVLGLRSKLVFDLVGMVGKAGVFRAAVVGAGVVGGAEVVGGAVVGAAVVDAGIVGAGV